MKNTRSYLTLLLVGMCGCVALLILSLKRNADIAHQDTQRAAMFHRLMIGFRRFDTKYGRLPSATIQMPDGSEQSWRVRLDALLAGNHLASDTNAGTRSTSNSIHFDRARSSRTGCVVVVGDNTCFPRHAQSVSLAYIADHDGLENTILALECPTVQIDWRSTTDLLAPAAWEVLSSTPSFVALFADGRAFRVLGRELTKGDLIGLFTPNGGETGHRTELIQRGKIVPIRT